MKPGQKKANETAIDSLTRDLCAIVHYIEVDTLLRQGSLLQRVMQDEGFFITHGMWEDYFAVYARLNGQTQSCRLRSCWSYRKRRHAWHNSEGARDGLANEQWEQAHAPARWSGRVRIGPLGRRRFG